MEKKKRKIFGWYKDQRLRNKILFAFIFSSVLPMVLAQIFMGYVNFSSIRGKMDELMVNELTQMAERVNLTLDVYTGLVYQIYVDNRIVKNLNQLMDKTYEEKEVARREIYERLQQYDTSAEGIECISIILRDGQQLTYDFTNASTVQSIWQGYSDLREITPYIDAQNASGIVITPTMRQMRDGREERLFHISKRMYDYEDLEKGSIATVVMSVNEQILNQICATNRSRDPEQEYSVSFIVNKNGDVLSYPDSNYSGISMKPDASVEEFVRSTGRLRGKSIAVNQYEDPQMEWIFYNVYDREYMFREITMVQIMTVLVACLAVFLSLLLIFVLTGMLEKSTKALMQGIQEVQKGNLNVKVRVDSRDEFGEIAENFNELTGKVQELITEVTDAAQKQKEAEIHALEAQINPHFLYNILGTIHTCQTLTASTGWRLTGESTRLAKCSGIWD